MILDDFDTAAGAATLDDLFRRAGVRSPDGVALVDPPNKESFGGGAPRTLTYAQADRLISAIAARLHALGLRADAVVAVQLPNTVEGVITLLGVMRAGMIAAPLPLLWRQQEIVAALTGIGAKAIVTGGAEAARSATLAAVELFPIRHVCAFGSDLPDGVVPLDDIFEDGKFDSAPAAGRPGSAAAHVALVTFDVSAAGLVPVARNHLQLMAGGLAIFLEATLAQQATLLSAIPPASFDGVALTLLPWLLAGGTLVLHHGGDPHVLGAQCQELADATLMLPGAALAPLAEAGKLGPAVKTIVALWRAPERLAANTAWRGAAKLVDAASFGELAILPARRDGDGLPVPIPYGMVRAPRGAGETATIAESVRTRGGTLALRGPMVPTQAFPPHAGEDAAPDDGGFRDTGFTCRVEQDALIVTGAPGGISAVGGYRFHQVALETELAALDPAATIVALPDGLLGQRLAGSVPDRHAMIAALGARGLSPLIAAAFRPRNAA
jgi:non-ribosomal peptide synthetase component E (peptide arylation enzyme)